MKVSTIPSMLAKAAKRFASKTAFFLDNGNRISYEDMMWDVAKTSRLLKEQGISKDSKVAIFMDNSPQCVESFLAVTKMGAVAVLLNYDFTENQIQEILSQEKPDAVFVSDYKINLVLKAENSTIIAIDDNRVLKQVSRQVKNSISAVEEKDCAIVMFTPTENGLLTKSTLTQKAFIEMTGECKKKASVTDSVNSIIGFVKKVVAPVLKGFSIKATV